ncbi:MAG: hypothetical protein OEL83_01390 [Desulforhopalus sp.]|nr:hypothetical protein [Desulforhopalus sp.]
MTSFLIIHQTRLAWCLAVFLPLASSALVASHAEGSAGSPPAVDSTAPQHGPIHSTPAGKSIPVSVTTGDTDEMVEVRLYFKTMAAKDYLFLPMTNSTKGTFTANLPPAKNDTKGIDYLLLFKNTLGGIRKTKPFRLLVLNDYSTRSTAAGIFHAQIEYDSKQLINSDFAVPIELSPAAQPLLAEAIEDPYTPLASQGSNTSKGFTGGLGDLGGVSFSINVGGVGIFYRGFSSQ